MLVSALFSVARHGMVHGLFRWLHRLGGPGLILLGLLDNSIVPIPGSMDVATVVFCAQQKGWWPYYALMATTGSVLGGYLTYRIARGEGKGRLGSRLSISRMKRVKTIFAKWGFGSIVIPALLPPPFPMVPFLIAAGATQYSRNKFLAALVLGRGTRYAILGLLGALYGRWILTLITQHVHAIIWIGVGLVAACIAFAFLRLKRDQRPA
ncbi:MAG TPA: VTT domain-containing protein [Candidatus Acidoferrales bacterium]|nr:VTT domain-containing protein [Candidatus Acidoferrales bacterium]